MYVDLAVYASSTKYAATPQWTATHAYSIGNTIRPRTLPGGFNAERCFICYRAGTSGSTEPAWGTTRGQLVLEAGPAWVECSGNPAVNGDSSQVPTSGAVRNMSVGQGQIITDSSRTNLFFASINNGMTGAFDPGFNTTPGGSTTDSAQTWICLGPTSGFTNDWGGPHATLAVLTRGFNVNNDWMSLNGMKVFLTDDHTEVDRQGADGNNNGYDFGISCSVISVDHTAAVPLGTGSAKAGAALSVAGLSTDLRWANTNVNQSYYFYGLTIQNATTAQQLRIGDRQSGYPNKIVHESCTFVINNTGNLLPFTIGSSSGENGAPIDFINCNFAGTNNSHLYQMWGSPASFKGCTFGGAALSSFALQSTDNMGQSFNLEDCDLSTWTGAIFSAWASGASPTATYNPIYGHHTLLRCKLAPGYVMLWDDLSGNQFIAWDATIDFINCDAGLGYNQNARISASGRQTTSALVTRTGGAIDNGIPVSHAIATINPPPDQSWMILGNYYPGIPLAGWNAIVGTTPTATVYGITNDFALPTNQDVWFDLSYLGDNTSTKGTYRPGRPGPLDTPTALTADTSAWDQTIPARLNSSAYSAGNTIKTTSNPGRVFFCVTSGNSAASEPPGYATAVDGTTVTDGAATFRAGYRFRWTAILNAPSPAVPGYLYAYPRFRKSNLLYFIDPVVYLN